MYRMLVRLFTILTLSAFWGPGGTTPVVAQTLPSRALIEALSAYESIPTPAQLSAALGENVVESLYALIATPGPHRLARNRAITLLGQLPDARSKQVLQNLLSQLSRATTGADSLDLMQAIGAYGAVAHRRDWLRLVPFVHHTHPDIRRAAARALHQLAHRRDANARHRSDDISTGIAKTLQDRLAIERAPHVRLLLSQLAASDR